jgi:hypothetical protein
MPGPPPNPNARRTNARPDWRTLPVVGRSGKPPAWPVGSPTEDQTELWKSLWATPQAAAWEDLGWTRVVARYASIVLACEQPDASAAFLSEARQLEDRLGLSPMAMKRLQWEIGQVAVARGNASVANINDYRELYGS